MRKTLVVGLGAALLTLVLVNAVAGNHRAIAEACADAARLEAQRDSLLAEVHDREQRQAALAFARERHEAEANRLRDSVAALDRRRAEAQLTVRQIRTMGALQARLRSAFPELGDSAWGVTTFRLDGRDTIGIEYLTVPAWFAETFVIEHANAESWRAQKAELLAVDSLRLAITALQDSITRLVAANADAYQTGYQAAYADYQDLSRRYVAELKKPRIRLGSALGLLGAAGVGALIGRTLP